jgi:hypothetical protein
MQFKSHEWPLGKDLEGVGRDFTKVLFQRENNKGSHKTPSDLTAISTGSVCHIGLQCCRFMEMLDSCRGEFRG